MCRSATNLNLPLAESAYPAGFATPQVRRNSDIVGRRQYYMPYARVKWDRGRQPAYFVYREQ